MPFEEVRNAQRQTAAALAGWNKKIDDCGGLNARNKALVADRQAGMILRRVAEKYCLSVERVRQIVKRETAQ